MTGWTNIGLILPEEHKKTVLRKVFDNYENCIVDDSPPTVQYGYLTDRELKDIVTDLFNLDESIETIVAISNSDTGDSAEATIYTMDNSYLQTETITGVSGAEGGDVKAKLYERDIYVPFNHHYNTLEPKEYLELWRDN